MADQTRLLFVGFGAFGQALANAVSVRHDVSISVCVRNPRPLPPYVNETFIGPVAVPVNDFDIIVLCLPSFAVGQTLGNMCNGQPPRGIIVSCVKGMDPDATQFMSQVIRSRTNSDWIAVVAGASFAHEIKDTNPVYLTVACTNPEMGRELIRRIETSTLRFDLSTDVRGMEVVGVAKNILAIGAGIADGLNLGENFRATYIARGVGEVSRLVALLGGEHGTPIEVGALSDIILTCSSDRSRNYRLGRGLAKSELETGQLTEGLHSVSTFAKVLERHGAHSPFFDVIRRAIDDPPVIASALVNQ